jgi:hypothetical protein
MTASDIFEYNQALAVAHRAIAEQLDDLFAASLTKAAAKVWHGHPVWFLDGNPVCGYSLKKAGIEVLFWSGKSFTTAGLRPIGKYQAAGILVETAQDIAKVATFMAEAQSIQWDYKNLPKLQRLEKVTNFDG